MPKNTYFSQDEYERRWKAVYDSMAEKGYETAVIWGKTAGNYERHGDLLYLTNYYSNQSGHSLDVEGHQQARSYGAVILHRGQEPELIMDMPSFDMDQLAVDNAEGHTDPIFGVTEALKRLGVEGRTALIGTDFLPMKYARQMEQQSPAIEWMPEDELVREVRQVKSDQEVELYRNAGHTMTEAISRLMEGLVQGKTEAEAAADAAYVITKAGGRFHMIPVSHGDSIYYFTRSPISGFSLDGAEPGDMVRGWVYGAVFQGYWMDPGRTAVAGRAPTPEQRDLTENCYGIVDGIIKAIRPGVRVDEVVKTGVDLMQKAGTEENQLAEMFPLFGHGIGLFWERPSLRIGLETDEIFRENMTFGIEAFLSKTGVGVAGYEDNILVTAEGAEILTPAPSFWW